MDIVSTGVKSSIFATLMFNTLLVSKNGLQDETLFILFLSFIIIFVMSFIGVFTCIAPFYKRTTRNNHKLYFPYYSITFFIFCYWFYYVTGYEEFGLLIGITIFFTAMYAWVDVFKSEKKANKFP